MFNNLSKKKHTNLYYEIEDKIDQTKIFGFWIYLMSDLIIFACLFATYIVLRNNTANGPSGIEIFNLKFVFIETILLLFSSITYIFVILKTYNKNNNSVNHWLFITFLFGLTFIIMEFTEFYHLINKDYSPSKSAFLSAFFTIVSTHGIHVIIGLIWIIIMICNIKINGINSINLTRLHCLSLFWHFLDIIWICVFSIVYLLGTIE